MKTPPANFKKLTATGPKNRVVIKLNPAQSRKLSSFLVKLASSPKPIPKELARNMERHRAAIDSAREKGTAKF